MRNLSLSFIAVASLLAVVASPQQAAADTIAFGNIPLLPAQAAPPALSALQTGKIAATEKVEGFFPAILPEAKRKDAEKEGYRYVQVFSNDKDQRDFAVDGTYNEALGTAHGVQQCLSTTWGGGGLAPRISFYMRTKPYPYQVAAAAKRKPTPAGAVASPPTNPNLRPVHQERMVVQGDALTLENIDALIDLETLGMRVVQKSSVKLAKVSAGPGGMGVFAARDEKGLTQFLVTHPELPAAPSDDVKQAFVDRLSSTADRLFTQLPTGSTAESGCGHVRFSLSTKVGGGQMATVLATAFLPPARELDEAPPDEPKGEEAAEDDENSFQTQMRKQRNRQQRARPVAVNVSLSQLPSEESPLCVSGLGSGRQRRW